MTDKQGFINAKKNARTGQVEVPLVPVSPRDATSKSYVDNLTGGGGGGGPGISGTWDPVAIQASGTITGATYTNLKSLFTRSGDIVTIYSSARFDDAALNGGTDYDFAFPLDRLPYDPANDDNGEVYSGIATLAAQVTAPSLGPVQNAVSTIIEPILFGGNLQIRFRITTALTGTDSILQLNFMFSYETNE